MSTTQADFLRYLRTLTARQATGLLSDQQLLERFLHERSEASFAALVARHGPMVLSVCRRVLQHTQDAEDAFQATFLVLARKASSIRKQASLGSWLHGVAYHSAERLRAKARRRAAHERRLNAPSPGDAMDDITWRELRSVLDEELRRLPEKYRAPLVLCYLEGRTQDEAAQQLGWSKTTFRRRLDSGRAALGRRLARRGVTLPAVLTAPLLADAVAQAALPPLLAASTVRAGLAAITGNTVNGIVSAQVAALAESGAASLLVKKAGVAVILLVSLTLGIGGLLAHRVIQDRTLAEAPAAPLTPQSPPARSVSMDQAIELRGRVLDPDGKPFAGARLFLLSAAHPKKADKPVRATTDKDGRFRFQAQPSDFDAEGKATLAAVAKEFGPDWIEITADNKGDRTLRLVKNDVPIEGRVLDLEGRPIPDVRVQVVSLKRGDLDAWFKGILAKRYPQLPERIGPEILGASASAVSGKDGRFRLTGFGRDRVVYVRLRGENVEASDFDVVTRLKLPPGLSRGDNGTYPARFDHLAGPSKPISGTVRDKRTGKPIAGISVTCPSQTPSWLWATTDEQGRYRITGVAKRRQYWMAAGGLSYFNCTKLDIADTPGLEPITVDLALERGIAVRGKLLDKITGKPIRGQVHYVALPDNPNLKDFTDINKPQALATNSWQTKADGAFTVVAIPGPGLLLAKADASGRYLTAALPEPKPQVRNILEGYHTIVRINPSEKQPQSATHDLYLEPAQTVNGTVIGPDGKPLAGAHYAGLTGTLELNFFQLPAMETASFTVGGISPKRTRTIVFVHAEKKLAKIQQIGGDTAKPLTIRLEPLAAIRGRILDAAGQPCAGLKLTIQYSNQRRTIRICRWS
jgi:RNA polymerase sigma factor (sigma-70 family)